jgi:hypothetical protein
MQTALTGLLMGNTQNSTVVGQIKGNNPNTYIPLKCQGINGCLTAMQNIDRNIKVDQKNLDNMKKVYVLNANQATEGYAKSLAAQLSPQIAQLTNQLKLMGISPPPVQGEQLEKDDATGLYKSPRNTLSLIGQYTAPAMPDLNGGALSEAVNSAMQAQEKANQMLSQLQAQKFQLQTMANQCQAQNGGAAGLSGSLATAQQAALALQNANCAAEFGDGDIEKSGSCLNQAKQLSELMGQIAEYNPGETSQVVNLYTGINTMCNRNKPGQQSEKQTGNNSCHMAYQSFKASLQAAGIASKNAGKSGSANAGGNNNQQMMQQMMMMQGMGGSGYH